MTLPGRRAVTLFDGLLMAHGALAAQDSTRTLAGQVLVSGKVRDAATGRPIGGATIATAAGVMGTTDEKGEFPIQLSTPGHIALHVRRLGYDSVPAEVNAPSPANTRYVFELRHVAERHPLTVSDIVGHAASRSSTAWASDSSRLRAAPGSSMGGVPDVVPRHASCAWA